MAPGLFSRIRTDVWIALVVVVASLLLRLESVDYPEKAATYPRGLLLIMAVLGTAVIVESLIKNRHKPAEEKDTRPWGQRPYVWALSAYLLVAVYASVLEPLGFVIPTVLFIAAMMLYFGERRLWLLALLSTAFVAFVYFAFIFMLNVPLGLVPPFLL